jgi:hypothetical protein
MGKDRGGIWGKNESKKGSGAKKGPPGAGDDDDTPKMGKKEAAAKAKLQDKLKEMENQGVSSMDCRHILVEKHGDAVKILEKINNGELPFNEAARQHSIDKAGKVCARVRTRTRTRSLWAPTCLKYATLTPLNQPDCDG